MVYKSPPTCHTGSLSATLKITVKNKKQQRKRFEVLSINLSEQYINPETGNIEGSILLDAVNDQHKVILDHNNEAIPNYSITQGYIGEKKFRILSDLPTEDNDYSFNFIKKLKRYDRILAIDTNSIVIKNRKINLGVAFHIIGRINQNEIEWEFIPINHLFVLIGESEKIENKNWQQLIEYIQKHKNYKTVHKIGIIVDSDLGNIIEYNKQRKPLCDNFFLPDNFELIYASDRANDNVLNHAIKKCHSTSKDILRQFVETLKENEKQNKQ